MRSRNYPGVLASALGAMLETPLATADWLDPQVAAQRALAAHPDFARTDGSLEVVVITAGDAPATELRAELAVLRKQLLACPCIHAPLDIDAATPGPQYECTFTVTLEGRDAPFTEALPLCPADGPCVSLEGGCCAEFDLDLLQPLVVGLPLDYFPPLAGQCLAPD